MVAFKQTAKTMGEVNYVMQYESYTLEVFINVPAKSPEGFLMDIMLRVPGQKEFQSIKLTTKEDNNNKSDGINIAELYSGVPWQKTPGGYKITFTEDNFKSLCKKYYTKMFDGNRRLLDSMELKLKVHSWPSGKGKKLFTGSNIDYKLPAFKYDKNGKIEGDGTPLATKNREGEFTFTLPSKILTTMHGLFKYNKDQTELKNLQSVRNELDFAG